MKPGDPLTSLEAWSRAVSAVAGEIATALARRRLLSAASPDDWAARLRIVSEDMREFGDRLRPRQEKLL